MISLDLPEPTRREMLAGCAALLAAAQAPADPLTLHSSGARDFDFLVGRWTVRHRRLNKPLANRRAWVEFPGTVEVRPILHGLGNVDENVLDAPSGQYLATSLRIFDRQSANWSIYWVDGRGSGIGKPVVGEFRDKVGHFYKDDELDGRPIKVRSTYRGLGPSRAAWDQALSLDGGRNWEVNWTMDFARKA